jgi:hypothetical protein
MMSLAAVMKAGAVCLALVPNTPMFCQLRHTNTMLICVENVCRSEKAQLRVWRAHPQEYADMQRRMYSATVAP